MSRVTNTEVRVQADRSLMFAVEISRKFDNPEAIYRALGARRATQNGALTAHLHPDRIWAVPHEAGVILHIDTPALADFREIEIPQVPEGIVTLGLALGTPLVLSLGGSIVPGLTARHLVGAPKEKRVWGGLLTFRENDSGPS